MARARTRTHNLTVFRADGSREIRATRSVSGTCWTGSIAAPVAHSFRCFAGNSILDPCVAPTGSADPSTVVCLTDPWSRAVVLRLTNTLPIGGPLTSVARPWAMQLAGGVRCVAATGTVPVLHDVALLYRCAGGGSAGVPSPATGGVARTSYLAPGATEPVSTAITDLCQI